MLVNHKPTGTASGMVGGLAWGTVSALILTLLLSGVLAFFISREVVPQENLGYGVMVILFLAGAAGYSASYRRIKRQKAMVFLLSALSFLVSLTALTALFFCGQFEGVFPTAMLIIGGSGTAYLLSVRAGGASKRSKIRKRIR